MLIDWTSEFSTWLDSVEMAGGPALEWATALLADLQDLPEPPTQETATPAPPSEPKHWSING